jgi:membrane dipeptidase
MMKGAPLQDTYLEASEPIHSNSIVIDGLTWLFHRPAVFLDPSRVTATNLTVGASTEQDFGLAIEEIRRVWQTVKAVHHTAIVQDVSSILACKKEHTVGIILGFQHSKPLETNLGRVELFHKLGVRIIQLTYNDRTYTGDGCLEPRDGGLSRFGERLIKEMNQVGVIVDLSHAGKRTSLEAIAISRVPAIFSHSNPSSLTQNPRNLSDEQIRAVAEAGGVIGCCTWAPICWKNRPQRRPTVEDFLDHIECVVNLVGIDHVSLASDSPCTEDRCAALLERDQFNAAYPEIAMPYWNALSKDPGGPDEETWQELSQPEGIPGVQDLRRVTGGLVRRGFSQTDIQKVLGGNLLRVFGDVWK